jgi:hypothetical protein
LSWKAGFLAMIALPGALATSAAGGAPDSLDLQPDALLVTIFVHWRWKGVGCPSGM